METSELIAILWHQGESDSCGGRYKNYYQKLSTLVNSFRKELDVPEVPFIVGGLGDYLGKSGFGKSSVEYNFINQELHKYAENNRNCYIAIYNIYYFLNEFLYSLDISKSSLTYPGVLLSIFFLISLNMSI